VGRGPGKIERESISGEAGLLVNGNALVGSRFATYIVMSARRKSVAECDGVRADN